MQTQPVSAHPQSLTLRPRRSKWQQWIVPPARFSNALKDAIVWIAAAVVLRLGVRWLIVALPALWPIAALIVMAPALSAAYLASRFPRLSLVLGYRSLLILLGLMLGGKL
ncbi:hypothetical protein H6F67_04350 [Microcoleus sp. FACHB-1515]|uniref:hypothetical protein n=1 Tax=Cyanophyceae TaxID=3028117 RepID=UPI001681ED91|nr:hypothetical protein [Microcoleus sp. FACHB-1515]MBD2089084.1 hypothetical protein [Microcoleus sp. FACHB-1515]